MSDCEKKSVYIVLSGNQTLAGSLIRFRTSLKFWNRYQGGRYNHTSISLDESLTNMMSFARKKINNPLYAGLIHENIHTGIFARSGEHSHIAVIKLDVDEKQFRKLKHYMAYSWENRDNLKYDFGGLFWMLLFAQCKPMPNHYVCSHWVSALLRKSGIYQGYFPKPWNVRPFDFYDMFREHIIYEGKTKAYTCIDGGEENARTNDTLCVL